MKRPKSCNNTTKDPERGRSKKWKSERNQKEKKESVTNLHSSFPFIFVSVERGKDSISWNEKGWVHFLLFYLFGPIQPFV